MTTNDIRAALDTWENPYPGMIPSNPQITLEGKDVRLHSTKTLREWCQQLITEIDLANERVDVKQAAYDRCAEQLVAERKERTGPIPMDGSSIQTPLTDRAVAEQRAILNAACFSGEWEPSTVALSENFARDLERHLAISRRSCAVLQANLEAEHSDKMTAIEELNRKGCILEQSLRDIEELNERLAERTRAYEEKDRKTLAALSKSCHDHWKTSQTMLKMKALLEDIEAAGRPHSRACECPSCEAWQAACNYLHALSTAPSCEGRNNETPPPELPGLTCSSQTEAAGHQPAKEPLDSRAR